MLSSVSKWNLLFQGFRSSDRRQCAAGRNSIGIRKQALACFIAGWAVLSATPSQAQVTFGSTSPINEIVCTNDGSVFFSLGDGDCSTTSAIAPGGIGFGATTIPSAITSIDTSGNVKIGGSLSYSGNSVSFGGTVVHGVSTPTSGTDAANKDYVDGVASSNTTKNNEQDNRLTAVETKNTDQDNRLTSVETKNTQQDTRLTSVETKNTQQDTRLTSVETTNTQQDTRLTSVEVKNTDQDNRLTSVENTNTVQQAQITDLQNTSNSLQGQVNALGARDRELADGIGVALALQQPILLSGQSFGIRVGYGNFEGTSAVGATAAGVINRGALGNGSSIVLDGGVGFGTETGGVSGRGGMTFAW